MMERIWQPATVLSVSPSSGRVRLRFDQLSQCERCLRGQGCGAGVFSQLFSQRPTILDLPSDQDWSVGQRVRVGMDSGSLVPGSIALYGWPLVGFLAGAVIGQALAPVHWAPDASSLIGGLLIGALTTWVSWGKRHHQWNPAIEAVSCDSHPGCA